MADLEMSEKAIRPSLIDEYIGQTEVKENNTIEIKINNRTAETVKIE